MAILLSIGDFLLSIALRLFDRFKGPDLHVDVERTGGNSSQVTFTATISNTSTTKPALGCRLSGELEGIGRVFDSSPFNLTAGQLGHRIRFGVERPRYGDLTKALNNETTLYGRTLTVRLMCGRHRAIESWSEPRYDPETDAGRYQAQQDAWRAGSELSE